MKNRGLLFWGLGAGLALLAGVYRQQRRAANASIWAQQVERQPGMAVVTGASAGIGAVFARALARQGYNLLLIARRADRLQQIADELQAAYRVKVEILSADLGDPDDLERAAARLAEIQDLDLLVNNAGFGTGGNFATLDLPPELQMIRLHVTASVRLIHAALPGMIRRHQGGIINVASIAGLLPMPGNATYGATKSYLIFFTGSLNAELAGTGVRVQALCPGFTLSEFHDVVQMDRSVIPSFLWCRAEDVVAESLQGLREGREVVIPGAVYKLLGLILKVPLVAPLAREVQRLRLLQMRKGG